MNSKLILERIIYSEDRVDSTISNGVSEMFRAYLLYMNTSNNWSLGIPSCTFFKSPKPCNINYDGLNL